MHLFGRFVERRSELITIRKFMPEDAAQAFVWCKDPMVSRFMTWQPHHTVDETRAYLNAAIAQYEREGSSITWGIVNNATGQVVGSCGFTEYDRVMRRAEVAYCLSPAVWGLGMANGAVAILETLAREHNIIRLQATCEQANLASRKLLTRRGWDLEGLLRSYALKGDGSDALIDVEMWSLII